MTSLVFVGDRCCDHSPSSGYDQVTALFPDAGWLSGKALEVETSRWHRHQTSADGTGVIYHVIYGDCSGRALPRLLRRLDRRCAIIATVHQPVGRMLADTGVRDALDECDALIAVTNTQAIELRAAGYRQPITVIPHGVSADVFAAPAPGRHAATGVILIIGSFLRDWELARHVLRSAELGDRDVIAIGPRAREELTDMLSNVEFRTRIEESELAELYRSADALFLPVLDGTASNALLEAMAAGCPVVCPRLPGFIDDYLGDAEDSYEPGQPAEAIAALLRVADPSWRRHRGRQLTVRSRMFDWRALRAAYVDAYAALETGTRRQYAAPLVASEE